MASKTICPSCNKPCKINIEDNSFDHEFGTETVLDWVSDCCEAKLDPNECDENDFFI